MENLISQTDQELDSLRRAILTEQERRANLASIPSTVADLAALYVDGGGDLSDIREALA